MFFRINGCVVLKKDAEILKKTWRETTDKKAEKEAQVNFFNEKISVIVYIILESKRSSLEKLATFD